MTCGEVQPDCWVLARWVCVVIAMLLALGGLGLGWRFRPRPVWRTLCPCCHIPIWLPRERCRFCGAPLRKDRYRNVLASARREWGQHRLAWQQTGQILVILAALVFVVALVAGFWG